MRFAEISLDGVYIAPIVPMLLAAWIVTTIARRLADRWGLLRHVWHPALFVFAAYVIVLWGVMVIVAEGGFHVGG